MSRVPYSLDRRLEQFQFKVQQQINITDDQLNRISAYYQTLQKDLTDYQDKLNRLNIRATQIEHTKKGRVNCKSAEKKTKASRLINDHEKRLKELSEYYQKQKEVMREDFENTYEEIDKMAQQRANDKVKPLEVEIKKTINLINKLNDVATQNKNMNNSEDEAIEQDVGNAHELEMQRIANLEAKLEDHNKYRLEMLVEEKNRLTECVNLLEDMERNHITEMEHLKIDLDNIDVKYREQVKARKSKQHKETSKIKRAIQDAEQQVKSLQKSLHRTEKRQREEMQKASETSEYLRTELIAVKKRVSQQRENDNEISEHRNQLSELNKMLNDREQILLKMRTDNETLKRDIARVTQDKIIAKRRAALNII
ncbi:hypothetical protein TRFO_27434 [Tritrichomonas foetus]|uniref:Uncharacterized protein n=1 Tax=Tritrichomonas foetus TaxID=1144522 RepID=A0A1J4K0M4_9EUKA|nr:hypothetical protein TRFO_27434 [Tritrichomonas foetus]|eukprot:OHT04935.1 hypothetical protein TRFO_27434 [Tritrichomonas foetus]